MIENQQTEEIPKELYVLKKHSYPTWIKIFGLFLLFVFLYSVPKFFLCEFSYYRNLYNKIFLAKKYFNNKNYVETLALCEDILDEHPKFKDIKTMAAKAAFSLTKKDNQLYAVGLCYLVGQKYKSRERADIELFLPEEYRDDFESRFEFTL